MRNLSGGMSFKRRSILVAVMIKKSVSIPEKLDTQLKEKSENYGISQGEIFRQALMEKFNEV